MYWTSGVVAGLPSLCLALPLQPARREEPECDYGYGWPNHRVDDVLQDAADLEREASIVPMENVEKLIDDLEGQDPKPGQEAIRLPAEEEDQPKEYRQSDMDVQCVLTDPEKRGEIGLDSVVHGRDRPFSLVR